MKIKIFNSVISQRAIMHVAFERVRRKIALLRTGPFVVGQFIARQLPNLFPIFIQFAADMKHKLKVYAT